MAPEIRASWPENEGENEASLGIFFLQNRPHGIHGFWSRIEPRNHPLDLVKILGKWPSKFGGFGHGMRGKMRPESWNFFLQRGLTGSMVSGAEKDRKMMPLTLA